MTTKQVGSVFVDSGQIIIIDPCYVYEDDFALGQEPTGKPYDKVCRLTTTTNHGDFEGGFATSTLYGDGEYPVYAEVDEGGRILRLTIDFDPEPESEDDEDIYEDDTDEDDTEDEED